MIDMLATNLLSGVMSGGYRGILERPQPSELNEDKRSDEDEAGYDAE